MTEEAGTSPIGDRVLVDKQCRDDLVASHGAKEDCGHDGPTQPEVQGPAVAGLAEHEVTDEPDAIVTTLMAISVVTMVENKRPSEPEA